MAPERATTKEVTNMVDMASIGFRIHPENNKERPVNMYANIKKHSYLYQFQFLKGKCKYSL